VPKTLDVEKLRASVTTLDKFRAYEREVEQSIIREAEDRRRKVEETRRAKEKRARKKRQRTQASSSS
jgi:hypothetical protein